MEHYTTTEIDALITRFEAQKLPRKEWTHGAHLVVAIWYNSHYETEQAINLVRTNITNHNASVGTPNTDTEGYHETITLFWMRVAKRFLQLHAFDSIAEACNALISSKWGTSNYPLEFYSTKALFSVHARHNWVDPDLKKLEEIKKAMPSI